LGAAATESSGKKEKQLPSKKKWGQKMPRHYDLVSHGGELKSDPPMGREFEGSE